MIFDTATQECPVSLLDPALNKYKPEFSPRALIQEFARLKMLKDTLGLSPYGGNLDKMPAKVADAFVILQDEHSKVESLRFVKR